MKQRHLISYKFLLVVQALVLVRLFWVVIGFAIHSIDSTDSTDSTGSTGSSVHQYLDWALTGHQPQALSWGGGHE